MTMADVDTRLQVMDPPRPVAAGMTAETPLVSLAWRFLRSEHQRNAATSRRHQEDERRLNEALAGIAEEVHQLRRLARISAAGEANDQSRAQPLLAVAEHIAAALAGLGVHLIAPEGEPYTSDLMELLDNIAQRPEPGATTPFIAEVVTPAVTFRGELLRQGQAVIGIPAEAGEVTPAE
jgi:hypothetical protein